MPAAAVIPAPIAYIKVAAVKKLVVEIPGFFPIGAASRVLNTQGACKCEEYPRGAVGPKRKRCVRPCWCQNLGDCVPLCLLGRPHPPRFVIVCPREALCLFTGAGFFWG